MSNTVDLVGLSYNIQFGKASSYQIENVAKVVKDSGAEIVAIQEVDRFLQRSKAIDQVKAIAEEAKLPYTYFHTTVLHPQASECKEEAQFGIAVLSKFPIKDVIVKEYEYMIPGNEQRIAIATNIDISQKLNQDEGTFDIWFVNTHIGLNFTFGEQSRQVKELTNFLQELKLTEHPNVLICGDFNSFSAVCNSINTMKQFYHDAWELYHQQIVEKSSPLFGNSSKGFGATFPAFFPLIRIDYFWLSQSIVSNLQEMDIEVINSTASDHRPLCIHLKWKI